MVILVGSGRLGGNAKVSPNGKPRLSGKYSERISFCSPNSLASGSPCHRNSCDSWPPMLTTGTIGTSASSAVRM